MEIQEIEVFVLADGTVKIEVRGVKGKQCLSLTADIEKLLGGMILSRELTPEHDDQDQSITDSDRIQTGW